MKHSVLALAILLAACGGSGSDSSVPDDGAPSPTTPGTAPGGAGSIPGGDPIPGPSEPTVGEIYPAAIALDSELLVPVPAATDPALPASARRLGDVNGDGLDDVAVFYPVEGEQIYNSGTVEVLFGTPSGELPVRTASRPALGGNDGFVVEDVAGFVADDDSGRGVVGGVTGVGDVNGDGLADFAFRDTGFFERAAWRVVPGAPSFAPAIVPTELDESGLLAKLDLNVDLSAGGDVNGDGADDLIYGGIGLAPHILYGAPDLNLVVADRGPLPGNGFLGYCESGFCSMSSAGDFDGDGYDDVFLSRFSCGYSSYAAVLYGSAAGIEGRDELDDYAASERTRFVTDAGGECFTGGFQGGPADVDADGSSDLLFTNLDGDPFRSAGVLVFGPRGARPNVISLDEMDGAKGVRLPEPYDNRLALRDADGDGFADVLFGEQRMFPGRARDVASVDGPVVRRGDTGFEVYWSATPGADAYRIDIDDAFVADFGAEAREASLDDPTGGAEAVLVLEALAADGTVLQRRRRVMPSWQALENPTAEAQAPRLLEVAFDGNDVIERYSNYLVWRDGVPVGRSINGADNYVDTTVDPATTYEYFVTPDYLRGESLDASALRDGPLLQRRSAVVEVTTPQ